MAKRTAGGARRPQERTRLEGEVRFYADGVEIGAGGLERAVLAAGRSAAPVPPPPPLGCPGRVAAHPPR